jgi:hypothetical protein
MQRSNNDVSRFSVIFGMSAATFIDTNFPVTDTITNTNEF